MSDRERLIKFLTEFKTVLPTRIAESLADVMDSETSANFRGESYKNDGGNQKWADRKDRRGNSVEGKLNYKKLDHTHKLRKSFRKIIKKTSAKSYIVAYGTNVPYAKMHNEGYKAGMPINGSSVRTPPSSKERLSLGRRPQQRRFLGIGSATKIKFRYKIKETTRKFMKSR